MAKRTPAKKKPSQKPASRSTSSSSKGDKIPGTYPKKTVERLSKAKRIGVRTESITEALSPGQVDGERTRACDAMRQIGRLEEEHKARSADAKAKIAEQKDVRDVALRNANAAKRDVEIQVEEWLDAQNNVLRVRKDTGEIIGDRTATMDELQTEMDLGAGEDKDGDGEADDDFGGPGDDAGPTNAEGDDTDKDNP